MSACSRHASVSAVLAAEIFASLRTAPVVSCTVPEMSPVIFWARTGWLMHKPTKTTKKDAQETRCRRMFSPKPSHDRGAQSYPSTP